MTPTSGPDGVPGAPVPGVTPGPSSSLDAPDAPSTRSALSARSALSVGDAASLPTAGRPDALPGDPVADRARLPERTRTYWAAQALLVGVPVVGVLVFWALASDWFTPGFRWIVVVLAAALLLLVRAGIAPGVRHRLFWYAVSETEIDIQHGFLVTSRTVVPMSRVQYLRTEHGVLADRFALANLHIHTAAGAVALPGLDRAVADDVRGRISRWAHLDDDL